MRFEDEDLGLFAVFDFGVSSTASFEAAAIDCLVS